MGWMKRQIERHMEEGWWSVGDKSVCDQCFSDYAIRKFIRNYASSHECSYCGRTSKNKIAAEMDEVLSFIAAGLNREYEPPERQVPWDSAEGGWQLPVTHARDLFRYELELSDNADVTDDLCQAFRDRQFTEKDPFSLSESDALRFTWESFSEQIKHKARFVFYRTKASPASMEELGHAEPFEILETIGRLARDFRTFYTLKANTGIVRARQHEPAANYTKAADLGTPRKEFASQSRMSPAGIAMFYGADSENTAFSETFNRDAKKKSVMTFGVFRNTRDLRLLDLTAIPGVPSLFDERRYDDRMPLIFFHRFRHDSEMPVSRNGAEHFEYVPTQVVAEYFRHVFTRRGGRGLDGIRFRSSRRVGGLCYSLFSDADDCCDAPPAPGKLLYLESSRAAKIDFRTAAFK